MEQLVLARLRQRLHDLPALPGVVTKLLALRTSSDSYFDEVVKLVGSDPGFATKLLAHANSAVLGGRAPVTRLRDAVMRVGPREAVQIMIAGSTRGLFAIRDDRERGLWRHALQTATLARRFAALDPRRRLDPEEAYVAGLLHDVGRFVLFLEAPEHLRAIDETAWETPADLLDAERRLCGFTHSELGFLAAQKWRLPNHLATFIRHHHATALPGIETRVSDLVEMNVVADSVSMFLSRTSWEDLSADALRDLLAGPASAAGYWNDRWADEVLLAMKEARERASFLGV